ncbi:MAG: hydroxypyruvate isomerase family protein [Planctomycetota bacterium]|jgi:hydroxypyruvate isomerase
MENKNISRRNFLGSAAAVAAVMSIKHSSISQAADSSKTKFKLKYAPHFGMFRHHAGSDLIDQLKFMADEGFTAMEDNNMMERPKDAQEKIARTMSQLDMTMGVFVGCDHWGEKTFVNQDKSVTDMLVKQMKQAVEVAKRVNAKWCTVLLDNYDNSLEWDYQTANAVENLKRCAEVCEPSGLVMVLEPLNPWSDHPGLFLTKIPQAYQICRAVNSPSCKILDDLYHQQITEGNLIPNMDMAWDEIGYFQTGDNPGRNEPTTGEINYLNIFKHIHEKGFEGIIGMEHGNSRPGKEGERAVIDAYRHCDNF